MKEISTIGHICLPQHLSTMHAESRFRQALRESICHHLMGAAGQQLEHFETYKFPKETLTDVNVPWQFRISYHPLYGLDMP